MTNKEDKQIEKRRLAFGIPKGAPKGVRVWSLTKGGREFLERLWEAFPELRPRPLKAPNQKVEEKIELMIPMENVRASLTPMIPMENVRASLTPEARARDKKMMEEFMKRVPQKALREFWENWKKERGIE